MKLEASRGVLPDDVAPRTGAWIETWDLNDRCPVAQSPPARGRGLKRLSGIHS